MVDLTVLLRRLTLWRIPADTPIAYPDDEPEDVVRRAELVAAEEALDQALDEVHLLSAQINRLRNELNGR